MRLSKEDKYELARAAIKARDVESLRDYLVSVVDAFDDLPPGKADVACPRYVAPGADPDAGRRASAIAAGRWDHPLLADPVLQPRV